VNLTLKVVLVLFILLLGAAIAFYQTRLRDPAEAAPCIEWYKAARTAAETSAVDLKQPPRGRERTEPSARLPSCGELRKLGLVP